MVKALLSSILQRQFVERKVSALPPHEALVISPDAPLLFAVESLFQHKVGSIVVANKDKEICGIFTERDLIKRIAGNGIDLRDVPVSEMMASPVKSLPDYASLARLTLEMTTLDCRHMVLISKSAPLIRVVSAKDIVDHIYHKILKPLVDETANFDIGVGEIDRFMSANISDLPISKIEECPPGIPLKEAIDLLKRSNLGCILVREPKSQPIGIFTERDYLYRCSLDENDIINNPIDDFMTKSPATLKLTTSIAYAFELMSSKGFRHIPVVNSDEILTGIISVKTMIKVITEALLHDMTKK